MSPHRLGSHPAQRLRPDRLLLARRSQLLEERGSRLKELVRLVEEDPVFRFLTDASGTDAPLVRKRVLSRCPGRPQAPAVDAEWAPGAGGFDLASALELHADAVEALRGLGVERAQSLLRMESLHERKRRAADWGLREEEIAGVLKLLEHLEACSADGHLGQVVPPRAFSAPVARVEAGPDGRLEVLTLTPGLSGLRYDIDYEGIALARASSRLSDEALRRLPSLLSELEALNFRNGTLDNLLRTLAEAQASFLRSGREEDLAPLTQRRLAASLGMHPSIVCRAVARRSILTPQGRELPLTSLLPGERAAKLRSIESLLRCAPALSDRELAAGLWSRFRIRLSRRSVALYRRRLDIPNVYGRGNGNGFGKDNGAEKGYPR